MSKHKGYLICPQRRSNTKLTAEKVRGIKRRIGDGVRNIDIAKEYGVSAGAISSIKRGIAWPDVEVPQ